MPEPTTSFRRRPESIARTARHSGIALMAFSAEIAPLARFLPSGRVEASHATGIDPANSSALRHRRGSVPERVVRVMERQSLADAGRDFWRLRVRLRYLDPRRPHDWRPVSRIGNIPSGSARQVATQPAPDHPPRTVRRDSAVAGNGSKDRGGFGGGDKFEALYLYPKGEVRLWRGAALFHLSLWGRGRRGSAG